MPVWRVALGVFALSLSSCPRPPAPATRVHRLGDLGLALTLPGNWYGGQIGGDAYIFTSESADCSLSFNDGMVGIPMSEAGARAFLEREGSVVESTRPLAFGTWSGFSGAGTLRAAPSTRVHFATFAGPKGAVWTTLQCRGRPAADVDTLWDSVRRGVR